MFKKYYAHESYAKRFGFKISFQISFQIKGMGEKN